MTARPDIALEMTERRPRKQVGSSARPGVGHDAASPPAPAGPPLRRFEQFHERQESSSWRDVANFSHIRMPTSASCKASMVSMVPPITWLRSYTRRMFQTDLVAGITVGVMLIPQSMAYSFLAGLPPIYGLYSSFAPIIVYAIFATSRVMAVGPVAPIAIIIASALNKLEDQSVAHRVAASVVLAFMSGAIHLGMGFLRMGFVVNFLSRPVMGGFISSTAFIIGASQLKDLLGIKGVGTSSYMWQDVYAVGSKITQTNWLTFLMSMICVVILLVASIWKRVPKWFPTQLALVAVLLIISRLANLGQYGVALVGEIPNGLPKPKLPDLSLIPELLTDSVIMALISFLSSLALAQSFAMKAGRSVDANQELIASGLSLLAGSMFQSHNVGGSFSRTAVNVAMGAESQVSGAISSILVIITLALLTSLFEHLPKAVLAAIVLVSVRKLFDYKEAIDLWKLSKWDFVQWIVAFLGCCLAGIQYGLITAIVVSTLLLVWRIAHPAIITLGRLPGTDIYRSIERFPEAKEIPGVTIIRMDAECFYANVNRLSDRLTQLYNESSVGVSVPAASGQVTRAVIIDASTMTGMDASAAYVLKQHVDQYSKRKVPLLFAGMPGQVRHIFHKLVTEGLSASTFFTVHDAVMSLNEFVDISALPHDGPISATPNMPALDLPTPAGGDGAARMSTLLPVQQLDSPATAAGVGGGGAGYATPSPTGSVGFAGSLAMPGSAPGTPTLSVPPPHPHIGGGGAGGGTGSAASSAKGTPRNARPASRTLVNAPTTVDSDNDDGSATLTTQVVIE